MRFQKILMTVTLVIAALSIVYALIFCSGIINQIGGINQELFELTGDNSAYLVYKRSQGFSDTFLILGVVLVLTVVLMLIMGCQSRRKYYITNYVAIGIFVAFALVFSILLVVNIISVQSALNKVDMAAAKEIYEGATSLFGGWDESTWMLTLGYVYMAILLVDVVVVVLNLVWKIKLMQGEKALLQSSVAEEVA